MAAAAAASQLVGTGVPVFPFGATGATSSEVASSEATSSSAPQPAVEEKKEERKIKFGSVPLILAMEEGTKRHEFRCTLKAVIYGEQNGRRSFKDIFVKGPWRRKREEAQKDQEEMSLAFKYDGERGVEDRIQELSDHTWTRQELEGPERQAEREALAKAAELEDDFDAEAASDNEPEPEMEFSGEELPVRLRGIQGVGPITSWDDGVARGCIALDVRQALQTLQLERPTLIQRFALPLISLSHFDLLSQAQTGSGKTLAFVIPIISRLLMSPPIARPFFPGQGASASPVAVMLSPTRELAIQTSKSVSELISVSGASMTVLTMYGGEAMSQQVKMIERQQMDIICATAGRLLDAIDSGKVSLMFSSVIVLDEADQMLDLAVGLEGQVMQLTDGRDLPKNDGRQTLLFSATMPDFQTKQFHAVLKSPPGRVKLRVGHYTEDEKGGSCRHIAQTLIRVRDMEERWERLGRDIMETWGSTRDRREGKGIIFTNRIALANPLEKVLLRTGLTCGQLHGRQVQEVREDIVKRFRTGEYDMLIASNVASRGLDFPDIRFVVQFELPKTVEIYTHRIGRTGRNGMSGQALSYFCDAADD
eukprot:NODE_3127_length_2088_cov_3.809791.p1 GENE.NODE_3127_length_2088_cov_3.809791~~NODE_3127_length_2088_cov_3.809791.p1  ORF type:complete len:650 (-),score=180.67 NODE_3127_length_2088_cov_3.809791:138-1916(-)